MSNDRVIAKLRGLRAERKLDLDTVSKAIGIHRSTLSVYENGDRKMPLPTFLELLSYYDVEPVNFFRQ